MQTFKFAILNDCIKVYVYYGQMLLYFEIKEKYRDKLLWKQNLTNSSELVLL